MFWIVMKGLLFCTGMFNRSFLLTKAEGGQRQTHGLSARILDLAMKESRAPQT